MKWMKRASCTYLMEKKLVTEHISRFTKLFSTKFWMKSNQTANHHSTNCSLWDCLMEFVIKSNWEPPLLKIKISSSRFWDFLSPRPPDSSTVSSKTTLLKAFSLTSTWSESFRFWNQFPISTSNWPCFSNFATKESMSKSCYLLTSWKKSNLEKKVWLWWLQSSSRFLKNKGQISKSTLKPWLNWKTDSSNCIKLKTSLLVNSFFP